jgi:HEAT repeat protein
MPLKELCITGKDANKANWLSKREAADAIASGRFDVDCKKMTAPELVAAFRDWSPIVRGWAAEELARRPEAKAMVPQLIAMAEGTDMHARQGACEALGCIKNTNALPVLVRLLQHDDRWLRVKAADALKKMGDAARPVLPGMLQAVVVTAEPLQPVV